MGCLTTSNFYARPIIPVLISFMLGITAGSVFCKGKTLTCLIIILCFILILFDIFKKNRPFASPLILFFFLGYFSILVYVNPVLPQNHISRFTDHGKYSIIGIINQKTLKNNRLKLVIDVKSIKKKDSLIQVTGKIGLTITGKIPLINIGDKISFYSKIKSIKNFKNPGGFDYKRFMAFKGIRGTSYSKGEQIVILSEKSEKKFYAMIEKARCNIADLIEKSCLPEQRGILKALVVGKKNEISPFVREAFNNAGTGHVLAISGLHIGIIATGAFVFFSWLLSFIPCFLFNAWIKKGAALLSLIPVIIYGLISGMSPSSQRAVIMVSVFLIAFLFEREHDSINTLSAAALLILIIYPPSLFSISFQLSFTAVFSIIYGISVIRSRKTQDEKFIKKGLIFKFLGKVIAFFLVSTFAVIGTAPLVMFYFNRFSMAGIIANLFVIPLIGFLVVPLGLISVFLYPISIFFASLCITIAGYILKPAMSIIFFFSDLPFAFFKTVTPSFLEICCYYLIGWALFTLIFGTHEAKTKIRKTAVVTLIIMVFIITVDVFYWLNKRFWHDNLKITVIDVGQGSASLLELPDGYTVLIDGGGFSDNKMFDIGARVLAPFLWRKKIRTVDTLILSHPNSDHLNGLLYIAENFNVKTVWSNNEHVKTLGYKCFVQIINSRKINNPVYENMDKSYYINNIEIKILYPPAGFIHRMKKESWRDTNNNSMVIKVVFNSISFLFPGDIEAPAERELVSISRNDLKSTVLIAPHHGSKTSSTDLFVKKVQPEIVIFSAGYRNWFNFPHKSVINRYNALGCRLYNTAKQGAVTICTNGKTFTVYSYADKN